MIAPPFPGFHSVEITAHRRAALGEHEEVIGRRYDVHGRTRCIAYPVDDTVTLHRLGAVDGVLLYAFVEYDASDRPGKLGTWRHAMHPDDLLEALETMRAALDPSAPRPAGTPLAELVEERLGRRSEFRVDIDVDTGG